MHDAASREGEFENLHEDISGAVNSALDRYSKYYDYMDGQDIYYIALIFNRYRTLRLRATAYIMTLTQSAGLISSTQSSTSSFIDIDDDDVLQELGFDTARPLLQPGLGHSVAPVLLPKPSRGLVP
jgi:hypothetical protein